MDDLLKEAIADAKAVRETALENAKMALEEAFTPRLQNMLSQKIQTEMEDEDEKEVDEIADEDESDDDSTEETYIKDEDEDPSDEASEEPMGEPEMEEEGIIEIDGVKYAPVVSEEEEDDSDEMTEEEEDDDKDLDLEAVIKELESEIDEAEENDDKEEVEESKEEVAEVADEDDKSKDEMDEDIDLDEVLKALSEEEEEEEEMDEVAKLKSDLGEHRSVIETLRVNLNEVNLLNAKLLFTNKLFRKYGLNNEQKMKVVEQFDRAGNLKEVKLVYSTLGETFVTARNNINESKGSASKPVASTKSEKKVISESTELRDRFKKLANLI